MDTLTFALFVIFALVVVAGVIVYSKRGGRFTGKVGRKGVEISAQDPDKPTITMEDVTAEKGSVTATAKMGGGIGMKGVRAGKDVTATSGDESKKV
jgi:hypothetical protein